MHSAPEFLQSLAVVFCVAGVTTVVFQKLRQPVIFGYLVAGMIVGPHIPIPLVADPGIVQALSELGVILLLFFLGLQFSLRQLLRVGPTAGVIALFLSSLMIWTGYQAGRLFGWTPLESFYAGALLAVSSTTIITKGLSDLGIKDKYTEVVFGICIFDDIIGIFLIAILTTLSSGTGISPGELAATGGRLAAFLAVLMLVGMLTVPRLVRAVVRLNRRETTLVALVGICFGFALLARAFGYSVALGAFFAGALVSESGAGKQLERLVEPVRDVFAAVFFVSVGMLIEPALVLRYWAPVLAYTLIVVVGRFIGGAVGTFFAGYGIRASVRTGMSLALIGEFSFIIASLGISTGTTRDFLYPVAVTVSAITTLLAPRLMRWSDPASTWIDRALPKPLRTFASLYDSWLEKMLRGMEPAQAARDRRRRFLLLSLDFAMMVGIPAAVSFWRDEIVEWFALVTGLPTAAARYALLAAVVLVTSVFFYAVVRGAQKFVLSLVEKAMPKAEPGKLDLAAAPRRALIVALEIGIVLIVAIPLLAFFQPFLPRLPWAVVLVGVLFLLGVSFRRRTADLQGHVKAVSQVIVESLAKQAEEKGAAEDDKTMRRVRKLFPGIGHIAPLRIGPDCHCVGKTVRDLNLGGLTGATILVVMRGDGDAILPTGKDLLLAGDVLTLAGTPEAVEAAKGILTGKPKTPR
jgi:CPA2 family monovalent cation:H+ antiporter-2